MFFYYQKDMQTTIWQTTESCEIPLYTVSDLNWCLWMTGMGNVKLEECRLQGVRKLAVNAKVSGYGKVSGYCVHLPVCNLQTEKSTEKVSRLRKSL